MAKISARTIALAALAEWRRKRRFADEIIGDRLESADLPSRERAFAMELFYGVLRNLSCLDFWIACTRTGRMTAELRDLLRIGLYQVFLLSTPEHAAVYETVEMATNRHRTVVNAVLRSAVRRKTELLGNLQMQPLAVRTSHPEFLVDKWSHDFGLKNTERLCQWNNQPPAVYARVNRLKIDPSNFMRRHETARPIETAENFVELQSIPVAALERGECYIQDPSTAIACELLEPEADEKILDACAAPGGKTGYLAEMMQNRGLIVACDRDEQRIRLLTGNLERLGVTVANAILHDWSKADIPKALLEFAPFDRILIDTPCSNTGVIRRRVDVRWRLTAEDFQRMRKLQLTIARNVLPLLKPGGILVYSTCSLEREENQEVAEELVKMSLKMKSHKDSLPFRDGFDGAFAAKMVTAKRLHLAAAVES